MGGGQEGRRREGDPRVAPSPPPAPPAPSSAAARAAAGPPPPPPLQVTAAAPHSRPLPAAPPPPLGPRPRPPSRPPSGGGRRPGGGRRGRRGCHRAGGVGGGLGQRSLWCGCGWGGWGMPGADVTGTPSLARGSRGPAARGGLRAGVPGLAVLPASGLPRPWRLQPLRNSAPSARPSPPGGAAWGGGARSDRGWRRGYITRGAPVAVCLGWGEGAVCHAPAPGLPVRAGWGEGEDAPASPGSPFLPTHPAAGAQGRRRWGGG